MGLKPNAGKGDRRAQELREQLAKRRAQEAECKAGGGVPYEEAVRSLHRSLEEVWRNDPCLVAYRTLRRELRSEDAAPGIETLRLFDEVHRADPDRHVALHHLAVLTHGGAIQDHLQSRNVSPETMDKWGRGLRCWAELVESDAFWKSLAARWESRRKAAASDPLLDRLLRVDAADVRRTIPGQLLEIHSRIVGDFLDLDRVEPARAHWTVLRESPFEAGLVQQCMKKTFDDVAGRPPLGPQPQEHAHFRRRCRQFLELEEGFLPALHSLCRSATIEANHWLQAEVNRPANALSALKSVSAEASHPALESAAPGNLSIEGCLFDYHKAFVEAALGADAARGSDSSQSRIAGWNEALRSARRVRRWGSRSRADPLVQAVILHVCKSLQPGRSSPDVLKRFLDLALQDDPLFAALHALRSLQFLHAGNARKAREHLENARRQLEVERDEVSSQLIREFGPLCG